LRAKTTTTEKEIDIKKMISITELLKKPSEHEKRKRVPLAQIKLFEHKVYKLIPGTKNSYREDSGNTNTRTLQHSHTYAKPKGKGSQLYAVNIDGSGHDGSSGIEIPSSHADYFRSIGYRIASTNILESLFIEDINKDDFELILLEITK
jgi:hypothetical protein